MKSQFINDFDKDSSNILPLDMQLNVLFEIVKKVLDEKTIRARVIKFKLQDYILKIHQKYKLTTLMVSHSISEIFKLSDKVIVVDKGKIVKEGTPENVFSEQKISSKFQLTGEIISITKSDIIYIVQVSSGNTIVKVVATEEEGREYKIGQKVLIASKAFNPVIQILK